MPRIPVSEQRVLQGWNKPVYVRLCNRLVRLHAGLTIHAMQNLGSKICWYESMTFAQSMNLVTPLTKRDIIVACALEVTVNFSRYIVIALNGRLSKDVFKLFGSIGCEVFFFSNCFDATTFVLLSFFILTISLEDSRVTTTQEYDTSTSGHVQYYDSLPVPYL